MEVLAFEIDGLARPEADDDLEELVEARAAPGEIDAEGRGLAAAVADSEAEIEATVRKDVEQRAVLGKADRMIERG